MSDAAIHLFTIGFTKKSAEEFFAKLEAARVKRLVDVRLNNISQLAGFTKKEDLRFFLKRVAGIEYVHLPELAPTADILDAYKKEKGDWRVYETRFLALMKERKIEASTPKELLNEGCLLCSEETPEHCHRRLVAEYLMRHWGNMKVTHLV